MGLLDKINNENSLKKENEITLKICLKEISSNSSFKNYLQEIQNLNSKNDIEKIKKANVLLIEPFEHKYTKFPNSELPYSFIEKTKKLDLISHINLENSLKPINSKISNLISDYSKQSKLTNHKKPYLLFILIPMFLFALYKTFDIMIWWWNFGWGGEYYKINPHDGRLFAKLWRFIVFCFSAIITGIIGYSSLNIYQSSKDFNQRTSIDENIKQKEREIKKQITNANNV